jgi:hypothetical protein
MTIESLPLFLALVVGASLGQPRGWPLPSPRTSGTELLARSKGSGDALGGAPVSERVPVDVRRLAARQGLKHSSCFTRRRAGAGSWA